MADEVQLTRLVVSLEARMNQYDRALAKARGDTRTSFAAMSRHGQDFERNMSRVGTSLLAAFGGAATLRAATKLIDTSTRITNSLKVAGLEGEALSHVYDRLFASAQKNAAPLESLVELYGRVAMVQGELGTSTEEMLRFTDNVSMALRVAGTDAASASGALLQLSQAMGSGTVRAEEFNSILEGALPIAQAAAAGLEEAGGSVAKLRALVVDGKVSSEAFFRAFEAGAVILETKVAGAEMTVSQAFVRLQNVLIDSAGKFNETSQAGERFASFLGTLGDKITELVNSPAFDNALNDLGDEISKTFAGDMRDIQKVIELIDALASKFDRFGESVTDAEIELDQAGQAMANLAMNTRGQFGEVDAAFQDLVQQILEGKGTAETAAAAIEALGDANPEFSGLQAKIGEVIQNFIALRDAAAAAHAAAANTTTDLGDVPSWGEFSSTFTPPTPVKPVSLSDYAPPSGGGGGRSGGTSEAEKQKKAVDDLVQSLADERAAVGMSATEQRVMTELRRVNIDATSEQGLAIADMIRTVETEADAFDRMQESLETATGLAQDFASTIVSGFMEGKDASEVLGDAVSNLMGKLAEMALNQAISGLFGAIFGGPAGAGGGSLLGDIFGFADGGKVRGPGSATSDSIPAMLSDGEYVVKASAATKHGALLEAINQDRLTQSGVLARFAAGGGVGNFSLPGGGPVGDFIHIELEYAA